MDGSQLLKVARRLFSVSLILVSAAVLMSCSKGVGTNAGSDVQASSGGDSTGGSSSGGDSGNTQNPPGNGSQPGTNPPGTVQFSASKDLIESELFNNVKVQVTATSVGGYQGDLDVKIENPEIAAIDPHKAIKFSASPNKITVPVNGSVTTEITVSVGDLSPSFTGEHFHVEFYKSGTQLIVGEQEVNFNVKPIFRIQVKGVGDDKWFAEGVALSSLFVRPTTPPVFNFIKHAAGLQVIFENFDTVGRIIHGSGAIPHQNVNAPMAPSPDGGTTMGGTYMPAAIKGVNPSNALVYLHNGENANAASRRLNFNLD